MEAPYSIALRSARLDDAPRLLAWESQPEVQRVTKTEADVTLDFIYRHILSSVDLILDCQKRFIVERDKSAVGVLDLYNYADGEASVGVFIDDAFRRCGYATKAVRLAIDYARKLGLRALNVEVDCDNSASLGLFLKSGFTQKADNPAEAKIYLRMEIA